MTAVKICGINSPSAFDASVEAGADFVGFVFFPRSPRYVTPTAAADLSARLSGGPGRVGLFVEPQDETIAATLAVLKLDAIQLYAKPERAASVRQRFGVPVWRAVGIAGTDTLPMSAEGVDRLLLDAQAPANASLPGGNAAVFDWSLLRDWAPPVPWLLAGGLTPTNVAEAVRATGAPAVDVSSGVERARGVKDPGLIRAFVAAVRAG